MVNQVILVDEQDNQIGVMEKLEAHKKALLHRAFSVFIFNTNGEMLLQKRALNKYHSPGLWTNTCCSHPKPNESNMDAANRRLFEEMNLKTDLEYLFKFKYKTEYENGLAEHEIDHVYRGTTNSTPKLNSNEASDYKYVNTDYLINDVKINPEQYTSWFKISFQKVIDYNETNKIESKGN